MSTNLGVFSFFSGSGLLDLGFQAEGFKTLFLNDDSPAFMEAYTFSRNYFAYDEPTYGKSTDTIEDFLNPQKRWLLERVEDARRQGFSVGFVGGPPCPDFSIGGKNKGALGDNGKLSQIYSEVICAAEPDWFLFENVKGLWRTKRHRVFFDSLRALLSKKYDVSLALINAIAAGVPQDRDRIFMFGAIRSDRRIGHEVDLLGDLRFEASSVLRNDKWPTSDTYLEDCDRPRPDGVPEELTVQHWFDKNSVLNHPNQKHCFRPRAGLARFKSIPEGDDSKKSFKRLHRWRYSPTAAYGNNEVHLHPYKSRRITVAEALAIQSMPPEFSLPPHMSLSNMFKTIGNGVPYLLSKHVARKIRLAIE